MAAVDELEDEVESEALATAVAEDSLLPPCTFCVNYSPAAQHQ